MAVSNFPQSTALIKWAGIGGLIATASMLGACAQTGGGSNAAALLAQPYQHSPTTGNQALAKAVAYWGKAYLQNPQDKKAALAYARNLKAAGQKGRSLKVLANVSRFHSNDPEIAAEYGRLALAAGQIKLAEKLLAVADNPAQPDWRVVSGRGTALAQQGMYKGSLPFFERALRLAPSNPSALSNLAMAHAGAGDLKRAEKLLREAMQNPGANPKVRKNLVAVLGLMGQSKEAMRVASGVGTMPMIRTSVGAPTMVSKHNSRGRALASVQNR